MIDWIDVCKLFNEIPPRQPRGSPENKLRNGPVQRFLAAKKRYEREWRRKWTYPDLTREPGWR